MRLLSQMVCVYINCIRNNQTLPQSDHSILHCQQQYMRVPVAPRLYQHFSVSLFYCSHSGWRYSGILLRLKSDDYWGQVPSYTRLLIFGNPLWWHACSSLLPFLIWVVSYRSIAVLYTFRIWTVCWTYVFQILSPRL